MKKLFFFCLFQCCIITLFAASWSFSGTSYVYFDNSQTQWTGTNLYLIIGKSDYSSVYPMSLDAADTTRYFASFPSSGWSDAEYMAVIGNSNWEKGSYGYDQLKNARYYTGKYVAGVSVSDRQKYLLTPQSKANGCALQLNWVSNDFSITFTDAEKNNCQRLDAAKGLVTIIYSTSSKRFNTPSSSISSVYVRGSVSSWEEKNGDYRLGPWSTDGCMFRVFRVRDFQRLGNSGCPEFVFHVQPHDGDEYDTRSHSSWEGGIDSRLVFVNNGENMLVLLPGDDIVEIGQRKEFAQYVSTLSDFTNLTDSATLAHLTNFRRVPATRNLFRSYHPYKPDRPQFETEHLRMEYLAQLGAKYGIRCDIALSGNDESRAGQSYTCNGKNYTISIPAYYQSIIDNHNVLYVGTANGHIPDYTTAVFATDGTRFAEWVQEVIRFIADDNHPAPFQIHCSLGADRTGAFCATLAALCGATWEQIATDYENTSNLRIQEYRHRNCVRYELMLLTGENPETFLPNSTLGQTSPVSPVTGLTLAKMVANHFISMGYLTQDEIDRAVAKLRGASTPTSVPVALSESAVLPSKVFRNGQLYLLSDNHIYSPLGTLIR